LAGETEVLGDIITNQYSKNYATEYYKTYNILKQVISNILKKKNKPRQQYTSKHDKATRGLSVVQRRHNISLACICFSKNKDGN
jgi:C-terminal processing protease CtpA/Prc